jgi:hypothetical protein
MGKRMTNPVIGTNPSGFYCTKENLAEVEVDGLLDPRKGSQCS